MCGIAGVVSWERPPDEARVTRMRRALAHRGPDGEGQLRAGAACLGHTRLALVDLDGGAQPMQSADGRYTLTYNGEVYNHRELRAELDGRWVFRTHSDSEVVLAAWAAWGPAALPRLNGMFAFFIWDSVRDEGFGARDRLGVKPFVYQRGDGGLAFASEAKALVGTLETRPRAHAESILEYLVAPMFSGVEHTMFDGVETLPAGALLRVRRGELTIERWWDWPLDAADDQARPGAAEMRATVADAVTRALRADVPVGVYLSGGLDSTLIAALARSAAPALPCFTIAFAGQRDFDYARSRIVLDDDEPWAELAARELGLARERCAVDRATLPADLAALATVDDALPAWEQELAQLHLARAARHQVKAVLVGDAADETHWGYHFLLDDEAIADPAAIVQRFGPAPIRRDRLADPVAYFAEKYRALIGAAGGGFSTARARRQATAYLIVKRWLARLLHNGDLHAMASSVEARVPFADVELLALAARVGPELGLHGGVEKSLLREAARGVIPEPIRTRQKSALPKDQAVARVYQREARRALDEQRQWLGEYLDLAALAPLTDERHTPSEAERAVLFRVVCLGHWAARYAVIA